MVQYPDARGHLLLREIATQRFERNNGVKIPVESVVLTAGSMQAISLLTQALVNPGDTIVMEEFTYSGSLNCFRKYNAKLIGAPTDANGIVPEELERTLKDLDAQGVKPKFLYTIPTNQNPLGIVTPIERRHRILEIAKRFEVPIVEDDCYADLMFGAQAPMTYRAMDPDSVMYVGSFSKILGPGLRVGYFSAKEEWLQSIIHWKIDGGTSNLVAAIAAEYLKDNIWEHVEDVNRVLKSKLQLITEELDARKDLFPAHSNPLGGLFIWVTLPEDVDPNAVFDLAQARGVKYHPGRLFDPSLRDVHFLRLAFGYPTHEEIRSGMALLKECVSEARTLVSPITTT